MRHSIRTNINHAGKKIIQLGTGVKDLNDQEIFEGDRLKLGDKVYTLRFCGSNLEFVLTTNNKPPIKVSRFVLQTCRIVL